MAALTNSLTLRQSGLLPLTRATQGPRAQRPALTAVRPLCSLKKEQKAASSAAAPAAFGLLSTLLMPSAAYALDNERILSALDQAESLSRQAADAATQAYDAAKAVTDQVFDAAAPVVEAAAPVVVQASKAAADSFKPVASELSDQAQKALSTSGVDIKPFLSAAKTAASVTSDAVKAASPFAQSALDTILAQEPQVLAIGAGALFLVYLIVPGLLQGIAYSARGYAGEFTAAQALDLLTKEDYTLIDIRTDNQRAKSGVPALPRNSKKKLVSVPVEELPNKLRSQTRNARKVEAEITALKICSLKRLNKGSRIIIIDSNADSAKLVAQSLANQGMKRTWIIKDGMTGGQGWIQSQLGTEEGGGGMSLADVLLPSRIISGTRSQGTVTVPSNRRLLTSGSD